MPRLHVLVVVNGFWYAESLNLVGHVFECLKFLVEHVFECLDVPRLHVLVVVNRI